MKRIACLSILLCVLMQAGGNALLVLQYTLNKEYITAAYCINKETPALACEGSCHLKKQLEHLDHSNTSKQQQQKLAAEIVWLCQQLSLPMLQPLATEVDSTYSHTNSIYHNPAGFAIEHPPQSLMHA